MPCNYFYGVQNCIKMQCSLWLPVAILLLVVLIPPLPTDSTESAEPDQTAIHEKKHQPPYYLCGVRRKCKKCKKVCQFDYSYFSSQLFSSPSIKLQQRCPKTQAKTKLYLKFFFRFRSPSQATFEFKVWKLISTIL